MGISVKKKNLCFLGYLCALRNGTRMAYSASAFFHIIVLPALSFVAHIIKTPYLCPAKRKYPSCTKARPKPRLYETLPRWFAIVGWLHDFSHCGSPSLLARDAARKSQNTSSVLVATFGGHEFFVYFRLVVIEGIGRSKILKLIFLR